VSEKCKLCDGTGEIYKKEALTRNEIEYCRESWGHLFYDCSGLKQPVTIGDLCDTALKYLDTIKGEER